MNILGEAIRNITSFDMASLCSYNYLMHANQEMMLIVNL